MPMPRLTQRRSRSRQVKVSGGGVAPSSVELAFPFGGVAFLGLGQPFEDAALIGVGFARGQIAIHARALDLAPPVLLQRRDQLRVRPVAVCCCCCWLLFYLTHGGLILWRAVLPGHIQE